MYGEDEDSGAEDNRPLSFLGAPYGGDRLEKSQKPSEPAEDRLRLVRTISDQSGAAHGVPAGAGLKKTHTLPARIPSQRSISYEGQKSPLPPLSPNPSLREGSQFALTNIDNPNDIAQELSNLQALRRMSMDVGNNTDPDLMPFSGLSLVAMPTLAPTGDDDEADPSRLLWVPARVHPELEPTAFKNFLENRVQSMKRRSGDSLLSVEGSQRNNSISSLRRKKSMLSRQIHSGGDGGEGYVDGAERLNRQHSQSGHSELSIDELVADPTKAVQKLAQEAREEVGESDIIIPVAPGMGLRRSTRTTYRKGGSIRNGDRVPFSKRVANRQAEKAADEIPPVPPVDAAADTGLSRTKSEPSTENFSRPTRAVRRQHPFSREAPPAPEGADGTHEEIEFGETPTLTLTQLPIRTSSVTSQHPPVPQIIETPPQEPAPQPARPFPERSSSQKAAQPVYVDQYTDQQTPEQYAEQPQHVEPPPARSSKRPSPGNSQPTPPAAQHNAKEKPVQHEGLNLNDMASRPMLPGSGGTTTTSLTFIPTMATDERRDRKSKDRDDAESISSTKSSGWKWFKSDDKEKKRREKEKEEQGRKAKVKPADNARLDVLQSSIDPAPAKGRESLLLDRDNVEHKLHEERRKESNRKASDSKKEKDGFFGGLFGGSKKKTDKEPGHKKKDNRPLTPEPPPRFLEPDVDYPWTRFPIIEERAIYRMAHIKLANPRRPLQSQVLLSNFMYSYLAKVQAMHPQLQVPISPQQKRQEEERKRREAEEAQRQLELEQQMAQQQAAQDGNFDFEYHRSGNNQYGNAPAHDGNTQYVDDSQIYEYEHGPEQHHDHHQNGAGARHQQNDGHGAAAQQGGAGGQYYYYGRDGKQYNENDERNDMW
ncbi:hypothetical protein B0T16DRAFT_461359 [Cercophora newfieldiana]|uniref:Protein Zds1 C-terminal domain-containing protein n=1 Tax=Cercophora newfieldiana TaxID=92897 RepID=A0AA39XVZ3_9PEZI|nr:hypothetical protein B0T16DRAFT_461359 [Cercophora newfieldiana]